MLSRQDNLGTDTDSSMRRHLHSVRLERRARPSLKPSLQLELNRPENDSFTYINQNNDNMLQHLPRGKPNGVAHYRRKGALSQYFAEFEVIRLLFAGQRRLDGRLRAAIRVLAAGGRADSTRLRHGALHAGAVAAACAWYSEWRAGVWLVSYH